MSLRYWLLLSTVATAGLSIACSSERPCYVTHTCPLGNAGGGKHVGDAGAAGESDDTGSGGRSAGGSGEAGRKDEGEAGGGGEGGKGGASDGVPVLFGACDAKGAFACVEHASAQRLACDGERWQAGTTCAAGQLCDSSSGKCAPIVSECISAKPGAVVCRADAQITCGADLVTASAEQTCGGLCKLGVCQLPTCGDEKVENNEDCDDPVATASGACVKCKTASCGDGAVYAGHEQCDDGNLVSGDGCSATCKAEPVELALGDDFTCARSSTGAVKCWGYNSDGELGLDDKEDRGGDPATVPSKLRAIELGAGRSAKAISARRSTVCALLDTGDVKCWGGNEVGQLGTGDTANRGDEKGEMAALSPIALGLGLTARAVSCAEGHTCVVLTDGSVKCWGSSQYGQLGYEKSGGPVLSPANVPAIKFARQVTAVSGFNYLTFQSSGGYYGSTCASLDDSTMRCWGQANWVPHTASSDIDSSGGIGDYSGEMNALPVLKFNVGVSAMIVGPASAAVLNDGSLRLWGGGDQIPGGNVVADSPEQLAALSPVQLAGKKVKSVALGRSHACAVVDDGVLNCWGEGYAGKLGIGSTDTTTGPPANVPLVNLGGRALKVAAGANHTCAILDSGTVKCWGDNRYGQLGLGELSGRLSPDKSVDLSF